VTANLEVRGGSGQGIEADLRFKILSLPGPAYNAELRVFVTALKAGGSPPTIEVYGTASWSSTFNWSTRPLKSSAEPFDTASGFVSGQWVTLSLSDAAIAPGDKYFALATGSDSGVCISNSGNTVPQLIIIATTGAAATSALAAPTRQPNVPTTASQTVTAVSATATQRPASLPAFPFTEDFESGLVNWSNSGLTVANDVVEGGAAAARSRGVGSLDAPGAPSYADHAIGDPKTDLWLSAAINVERAPSQAISLLTVLSSARAPIAIISLDNTNEINLIDPSTGAHVALGALEPNSWRAIELHVLLPGDNPKIEVWRDGEFAGAMPLPDSARTMAFVRLGDGSGSATFDVAYDDVTFDRACMGACPAPVTPTAMAEATATSSATPTEPPTDTPTAEATPTETPSVEPAPTDTPIPTSEPETPTETPTDTPTETVPVDGSPPADAAG